MNSATRHPEGVTGSGARAWRAVATTLGIVLILAGVLWGALMLMRTEETITDTVTEEISAVLVDNGVGQVIVRGSDAGDTSIQRTLTSTWATPDERISVTDGSLEIVTRCTGGLYWVFDWCGAVYEITVPAGVDVVVRSAAGRVEIVDTRGAADAESSAGRVEVRGAEGPVRAHSSAGRVLVEDVEGAEVDARSSAGQVEVRDVEVTGAVSARSQAGQVRIERVTAATMDAHSGAGGVQISTDGPFEAIVAESSAGAVTVSVPDDAGPFRVDADSSAGGVTVDVAQDSAADTSIRAHSSAGAVMVEGR